MMFNLVRFSTILMLLVSALLYGCASTGFDDFKLQDAATNTFTIRAYYNQTFSGAPSSTEDAVKRAVNDFVAKNGYKRYQIKGYTEHIGNPYEDSKVLNTLVLLGSGPVMPQPYRLYTVQFFR